MQNPDQFNDAMIAASASAAPEASGPSLFETAIGELETVAKRVDRMVNANADRLERILSGPVPQDVRVQRDPVGVPAIDAILELVGYLDRSCDVLAETTDRIATIAGSLIAVTVANELEVWHNRHPERSYGSEGEIRT
jgi:hypothetical protein